MTLTFDVYTKRSRLFYIEITIAIFTALLIAPIAYFNPRVNHVIEVFIDILIIAGSLTSVMLGAALYTGVLGTYRKDQELILTDGSIVIDGVVINLTERPKIALNIAVWTRKRAGNFSKNTIDVANKSGRPFRNQFVIKLYQKEDFKKLLDQWRENGISFDLKYHEVFT